MTAILVLDVGTTSVRAAIVDERLQIVTMARRPFPPSTPFPGLVEFDAAELARVVLDAAQEATAGAGTVDVVGITNQRASTILWDRATGDPVAPALGWQDLRTVGECIVARAEHDLALAPNQSATKLAWLLDHVEGARDRDLCFGTVDSWLAWTLSGGALHVTDHTNAAVTGLLAVDGGAWSERGARRPRPPGERAASARRLVRRGRRGDRVGRRAADRLPGRRPAGVARRSGLCRARTGEDHVRHGRDARRVRRRSNRPPRRSAASTARTRSWRGPGTARSTWGAEGILLSAGTNVEWLRDDLGLIATSAESHDLASSVDGTDGVLYVPALLGLGTPHWDYGARGTLVGLTRGTTRAHVVRAVLEGVAHRGADLVEAAEADTGLSIEALRVDGGMSANPTFTQALADATGRPVEVSPVIEATTLGAAFLAGLAVGVWDDIADADRSWSPERVHEPAAPLDREAWSRAVGRAVAWYPELSALDV